MKLSVQKDQELRDAIMQQAKTGLTDKQIARRLGVSISTITRRRREIADSLEGRRDPEFERMIETRHRHAGKRIAQHFMRAGDGGGDDQPQTLKGLLDAFPDARVLTLEERERLLSIIALRGAPNVQVQALKSLDDLQRAHRPKKTVGPPPPLTEEERVERLAVLLDCCGEKEAGKAWERAFGKKLPA